MSLVCPTVLARDAEEFREQLQVAEFADRIQIDLGDGIFTSATVGLDDIYLPEGIETDLHLMYQKPHNILPKLIALQPSRVIVHAEADGDLVQFSEHLKGHGIGFGISLLQKTTVASARDLIIRADHVLIFSGSLGSFGGRADLALLGKVPEIKTINKHIEIGWDGGINRDNVPQLVKGGVDVLNVGGAIQKALQPENAYRELLRLAQT